jgi:hypothetical protein
MVKAKVRSLANERQPPCSRPRVAHQSRGAGLRSPRGRVAIPRGRERSRGRFLQVKGLPSIPATSDANPASRDRSHATRGSQPRRFGCDPGLSGSGAGRSGSQPGRPGSQPGRPGSQPGHPDRNPAANAHLTMASAARASGASSRRPALNTKSPSGDQLAPMHFNPQRPRALHPTRDPRRAIPAARKAP